MNFEMLSKIKKFTPIEKIFYEISKPQFQLDNRQVYYMGDGFLLSFSNSKFKVENSNRVEYGDKGEFALSIYYFQNKSELEKYFKIKNEYYDFGYESFTSKFEIIDDIYINDSFEKVSKNLRTQSNKEFYTEGETNSLNSKKEFEFLNRFITFKGLELFFFEKSKKTQLTGFEFLLND